jgi:ectoine hydroxylase-related dioxygenase (phytanoyl-CoA dioxygenase family)
MHSSPPGPPLDQDQLEHYLALGYLQVDDLLTPAEVDAFLEHERQPGTPANRGLQNHKTDAAWMELASNARVTAIASLLLEGAPRIVQTMYLAKAPGGGTGVALHQDTHYIRNEPNSLMACWVALSDTGPGNGGLCVAPASHQGGLRVADRATDTGEHASWEMEHEMSGPDGDEWKETLHSFDIVGLDDSTIERLTVRRGSGVFFTGMTIHGSYANRSPDRPRLAFATHFVREGTWIYRRDLQDTAPVG